jgi:hypothetical protein
MRLHAPFTSAHVLAIVALFAALGGTGYAAAKIGSAQIKDNSVKSKDLKDGGIAPRDLAQAAQTGATGPPGPPGAPGPRGPVGPSNAYSAFKGSADVPDSTVNQVPTGTPIVTLSDLPPGAYVIMAKLWIRNGSGTGYPIRCILQTGEDFDITETRVDAGNVTDMVLNVVRIYGSTGQVTLRCADDGIIAATAHYAKVTAIRVGEVRNLPSP